MGGQYPPKECEGLWEMRNGVPWMLDDYDVACRELSKDHGAARKQMTQELFSDANFLQTAVHRLKRTPVDDPNRLSLLLCLAHFLHRIFEIDEPDLTYLDEAKEYIFEAIDLSRKTIGRRNLDVALPLGALAYNYVLRSSFTLEKEDASRALTYGQHAINFITQDATCEVDRDEHPSEKTIVETEVGALYPGQRFMTLAVKSKYISILRSMAEHRHRQFEPVTDLRRDIQPMQEALEAVAEGCGDESVVNISNSLCEMFADLFMREGLISHLDLAITYGKKALGILKDEDDDGILSHSTLRITPRDSNHDQRLGNAKRCNDTRHRLAVLNNLARSYQLRSSISHEAADEDEAIYRQQQAISITPPQDPRRFLYLNNLASLLRTKFRRTEDLDDIDEAIDCLDEACRCQPEDYDDPAFLYFRRGVLYQELTDASSERTNLENTVLAFLDGFGSTGALYTRLACAYRALMICGGLDRFFAAYLRCSIWPLLLENMVPPLLELFPSSFFIAASQEDGEIIHKIVHGWPSPVASLTQKGMRQPAQISEALEVCRGILASGRFSANFEIAGNERWMYPFSNVLHTVRTWVQNHPNILSWYTNCHHSPQALDSESSESYPTKAETIQILESTVTRTEENPRPVTGYERFLLPPTADKMMEMACEGSIVTFVVTPVDSVAILITSRTIQALPLHDLRYPDVRWWAHTLRFSSNRSRRNADLCEEDEIEDLEEQVSDLSVSEMNPDEMWIDLWNAAIKPVLQQLQVQRDSDGKLPRIWWVGGGHMSRLPLHAAGYHDVGATQNTLSHVVSSYAYTIQSLQRLREKPPKPLSPANGALVLVSMPTTPGGYDPLNVAGEVQAIKDIMSPRWSNIADFERPNKQDVLKALRTCSVAHFACHGSMDYVSPTRSSLLLGSDILERLAVQELNGISSANAEIIYLSACSTAETGGLYYDRRKDSSTHLVGVFHTGGFSHVIGTMWGADDEAAAEVAKHFYGRLLDHTGEGHTAVARALHDAMLSFRNQGQNRRDMSKWAPFAHFGC
jgi:CHAT domain-containing protein/tetratricopeptide (TPR) repeat protein